MGLPPADARGDQGGDMTVRPERCGRRVPVDPTVAKEDLIARVAFNFDRDSACDLMAPAILGGPLFNAAGRPGVELRKVAR